MEFSKKIKTKDKSLLLFSLLTALAFLVRYLIATQDLTYLDRLFIPDDTYYILSISRSLAAGLGPTTDGLHLTSGFQPLICLIQLPIFLGYNGDKALLLAIYLSAFWGGLSTLVLAYLLNSLSGKKAALIASLLWIFCPIILKNDLNAMETSLAGFLSLLAILTVVSIDKKEGLLKLICLGLICGLAILARIDSCFLLLTIGIFTLKRWGFYKTALYVFVALLVVLPWWIYAFKIFGSIVPESGMAIKEYLRLLDRPHAWTTLISLYALIEWFPLFKYTGPSAFLGLLLTFYCMAKGAKHAGVYGYLLVIPLLLQFIFYTFYLPAFWFFTRYYYVCYALIIICISLLVAEEKRPKIKPIYFGMLFIILVVYLVELKFLFAKPEKTPKAELSSLTGYREVALELNDYLAPGDVVGAFQSGALAYYAKPSVRVINLDGVVNAQAKKALKQRAMKTYVDSQQMNRFADWEGNATLFKSIYGPDFPSACFNTIHQAKKQGSQTFVLRNYSPNCTTARP